MPQSHSRIFLSNHQTVHHKVYAARDTCGKALLSGKGGHLWLLPVGFMMSNFEADDADAFKGQGCGALPFAGWEDPPLPLAALHHLHQVSHNSF